MGIRLDWDIEAEQEHHQQSGGEDPETKRKRRRAQRRFLVVLLILLLLIGGVVGGIELRLRQQDEQNEQVLRDTVTAEVTALRVGDKTAFLAMQRSATPDWLQAQGATFDRYQALMQSEDVNLTGDILDVQIDGSRGRVQVEEILGGVPYGRVWFYWNYPDGWHHVPPDYTFWGDGRSVDAKGITVRYEAVDENVAQAVASTVSGWLSTGCAALDCDTLPRLTVEILPSQTQEVAWSSSNSWTLEMPSPYVTSARLDQPFDTGTQIKVAGLVADRLVGDFNPTYPTDAYDLRQAIVSWLVQQFAQVETNSFLVSSLAQHFGNPAVGQLLHALAPGSDVSVLSTVTGTSLDTAALDWRDFLTWRLTVENQLIKAQDQPDFLDLYDTSDATVRSEALARFAAGASSDALNVVSAISGQDSSGTPQLQAVVQIGNPATRQENVLFRLVGNNWKRAS